MSFQLPASYDVWRSDCPLEYDIPDPHENDWQYECPGCGHVTYSTNRIWPARCPDCLTYMRRVQ